MLMCTGRASSATPRSMTHVAGVPLTVFDSVDASTPQIQACKTAYRKMVAPTSSVIVKTMSRNLEFKVKYHRMHRTRISRLKCRP